MKDKINLITILFICLFLFNGCGETVSVNGSRKTNKAINNVNVAVAANTANNPIASNTVNNSTATTNTVNDTAGTNSAAGKSATTNAANNTAGPVAPPVDPKFNAANFNKLETGMKYAEVVKILGSKGQVDNSTGLTGGKIVMYKWTDSSGAFVKVIFQDDMLLDKVQTGLR